MEFYLPGATICDFTSKKNELFCITLLLFKIIYFNLNSIYFNLKMKKKGGGKKKDKNNLFYHVSFNENYT